MSLGQTLRQAREQKCLTASQVADATRMMVQVVEDLERDDYRRVAAPIYGRGFVKLYAEHLGLDPAPLIQQFMEVYAGSRPPQVARRVVEEAAAPAPSETALAAAAPEQPPAAVPAAAAPATPALPPSDTSDLSDESDLSDLPAAAPLEPDLFSVAAGRSAAVRSVAEPSRPGDVTPPRVRPVSTRPPAPAAAGLAADAPATAPATRRLPRISAPSAPATAAASWLPAGWTGMRLAATAGLALVVVALLVLGLRALMKATQPRAAGASSIKLTERVLPPPTPYFD